ncbi:MAG: iron-sulfur cluster carrier protein ApbC [Pseudomonadota bacterium]
MAPTLERDQILSALRSVLDPDRGGDIVSLDMVSGLSIDEGRVTFAIEVDPKRGPKLEPLRQEAERAVNAVPGVASVSAILTAHNDSPAKPDPTPQPRQQPRPQRPIAPDVRHIVAVASGKGGVGKSTVSVNLALSLAARGATVGLLDADIYGPSIPRMMAVSGKPDSPDGKSLTPMIGHGIPVMSIGFLIEEETPMIWRGPMVQSAITQMLRDVTWGALDYLIVDMPPGTGDAQLTMAQQVPLSGAVVVSTPQDIALLDARKGLAMFRKVDVPVLGIVENMSYFVCPSCGHRSDIFGHGGARQEADRLKTPFLGEVPLHMAIRETSDAGNPIVLSRPEEPQAKAFFAIADSVMEALGGSVQKSAPTIRIK